MHHDVNIYIYIYCFVYLREGYKIRYTYNIITIVLQTDKVL